MRLLLFVFSFLYLSGFEAGLAGEKSNCQALFKRGSAAIEAKNWPEAYAYLIESIGAVIHEQDLPIAVKAVTALEKVYRYTETRMVNSFPSATLIDKRPFDRRVWPNKNPVEEDLTRDAAYWANHPYFRSLLTANQLCHEALTQEHDREHLLLLALNIKPGYLPTILAVLRHYLDRDEMVKAKQLYYDYHRFLPSDPSLEVLATALAQPKKDSRGFGPEDENRDSIAAELYRQGDEETLRARLKRKDPEDFYYLALTMYRKTGFIMSAEKRYLEKAAKSDKDNPSYLRMLATWSDENEKKKAKPYFAGLYAHAKKTESAEFLYQAARMAGRGGTPNKAQVYTELIEKYPHFRNGFKGLQWLKNDEALAGLEKLLSANPNNAFIWEKAKAFFKRRRILKKGFALTEKCFAKNPRSATIAGALHSYAGKFGDKYGETYVELLWAEYLIAMKELDLYQLPLLAGKLTALESDKRDRQRLSFYLKSLITPMRLRETDFELLKKSRLGGFTVRRLYGDFLLIRGIFPKYQGTVFEGSDILKGDSEDLYHVIDVPPNMTPSIMIPSTGPIRYFNTITMCVHIDFRQRRPLSYLNNIWDWRRGGGMYRFSAKRKEHYWRVNFFPQRYWNDLDFEREVSGDRLISHLVFLGFDRSWLKVLDEKIDLRSDSRFFGVFPKVKEYHE